MGCSFCGLALLQPMLAGPALTTHCFSRERLVHELDTTGELLVDLGSDQTSCHNPFNGGYYPVQLSFSEAQSLMSSNPAAFKHLVQERWVTGRDAQGRTAEPTDPNLSEPWLPSLRGDGGHVTLGDDETK